MWEAFYSKAEGQYKVIGEGHQPHEVQAQNDFTLPSEFLLKRYEKYLLKKGIVINCFYCG